MLLKIFGFYFIFLSYLFLGSHLLVKAKLDKPTEVNPVEKYKSPGSIRYPVGDEELNNNLFDEVGINEAMEKHDKLSEFGLKCRELPDSTEVQDPHCKCESSNPAEIIFTSNNLEIVPEVQCRKCDLRVTSDGSAVVVRCFDCLDIPQQRKDPFEIIYLVYYIEIANYTSRS